MINFPKDQSPKNRIERIEHDKKELKKRDEFQMNILNDMKHNYEIPVVQKLPLDVYPIAQKCSKYSKLPYGLISTVQNAGCGPLAVEYALRLIGFQIDFVSVLNECVIKGYRGYIRDEEDKIIDGLGTKYSLFSNIATELTNLEDILSFLQKGVPITILIQNSVYHNDEKRKGNHFITLVGVDKEKNAILMDGYRIETENDLSNALVRKTFEEMLLGLRGAWAWESEKVKIYLK